MSSCTDCVRPDGWCASREKNPKKASRAGCSAGLTSEDVESHVTAPACDFCGGQCCDRDYTNWISQEYLKKFNLPNQPGCCPAAHPETGCVLPREARSFICLDFQCLFSKMIFCHPELLDCCKDYGQFTYRTGRMKCREDCPKWAECPYPGRIKIPAEKDHV